MKPPLLHISTSFFVMALRSAVLVSKFLLLTLLSRYFTPEELGLYGLMSSAIAVSQVCFGLNFYHYVQRQMVTADDYRQAVMLKDQGVFHGFTYLFFIPLLFTGIFINGTLPMEYAGWFFAIAVLEHLAQEGHRLMMLFSRPVMAMVGLFLRNGVWIYIIAALLFLKIGQADLGWIWYGWALGAFSNVALVTCYCLHFPWKEACQEPVNWRWLGQGIKVSCYYFGGAVCMWLMPFLELFFLKHFISLEKAGIYTFFIGIARAVQILVNSGTAMILTPHIVRAYRNGDMAQYAKLMRQLRNGVLGIFFLGTVMCIAALEPIMWFTDKTIYREHINLMWILLPAMFFYCLTDIPHLVLYAKGRDKSIFFCNVSALITAITMHILLVPHWGINGTAMATLCGMVILFSGKGWCAWKKA